MAHMLQAKTEDEVKSMTVSNVKKAYNLLADTYNKIINKKLLYCHKCGEHLSAETTFYSDDNYASGKFPICKKCIMNMVEQKSKKTDEPNETKESVQKVLHLMDLPYNDEFYEACIKGAGDSETGFKEKNRKSPFATYITCLKSLPQWKGMTWADSDFGMGEQDQEDIKIVQKTLKAAKKRFGNSYNNEELMFLENEYQDWQKRYPIENKSQEVLYKQICFIQLNIDKAQRAGKDTKDLLKSLQEVMSSLQIKPSQNNSNALTEAKTFGQLIASWEENYPIPEPDEDFKDIDGISEFVDVFMRGHLAKMMGLKNGYSEKYDSYIAQYSAKKREYEEDETSKSIYDQLFGGDLDE